MSVADCWPSHNWLFYNPVFQFQSPLNSTWRTFNAAQVFVCCLSCLGKISAWDVCDTVLQWRPVMFIPLCSFAPQCLNYAEYRAEVPYYTRFLLLLLLPWRCLYYIGFYLIFPLPVFPFKVETYCQELWETMNSINRIL